MVRIHQHAKFQAISSLGFPENAWKPQIWPVSLCQNSTKIIKNHQTVTMILSILKVVRIQQHTIFQAIPSMRSPGNARKPQILPVSRSQNSAKITKVNRQWPRTNQFWRWSRYISMQNFRPFPPCVLQDMPGNPQFDPFHEVKIVPKLEKSTNRGHKLISSEGDQDTSACKISGHSLHAFSGKCPETPNLTRFTKSKWRQN